MTIRGLAYRILGAVVRRASPSMQEWGKAMLGELAMVEGDWAALFWALGGAKSLLWGEGLPMRSLADVPRRVQRFEKAIVRRTVLGSVLLLGIFTAFGFMAFTLPNLLSRVGARLIVAAVLFGEYQLYLKRLRPVSAAASSATLVENFLAELARQRDFHRGVFLWSRLLAMFPGYFVLCFGIASGDPAAVGPMRQAEILFRLLAVIAVFVQLRDARRYQRQIDQLVVLKKELT